MCFGCGSRNARGLQLTFELDASRRRMTTRWTPTKDLQGYADIVHGGMTALVLDELMVNLLWKLAWPAVTGELAVRFHRPARVGHPLTCEAHVQEAAGRLIRMRASATDAAGTVVATATARCVRLPHGRIDG